MRLFDAMKNTILFLGIPALVNAAQNVTSGPAVVPDRLPNISSDYSVNFVWTTVKVGEVNRAVSCGDGYCWSEGEQSRRAFSHSN